MRTICIQLRVGALLAWALSGSVAAAEIVVISNSGVKLTAADVRDVYLGEKQFADSIKLVPVDNHALQVDFLAKAVRMEAGRYNTAWTKKAFRDGVNAPAVKASDAEVIEFVKRTPGAVGYVSGIHGGVNAVSSF